MNQVALKKGEKLGRMPRILTANIGNPIGLTRNAMAKRMIPFFGEYVTKTITPRSATMLLTIRNRIAEQEIIQTQASVNRSMVRTIGAVNNLNIHFIGRTSFSRLLYGQTHNHARMWQGLQLGQLVHNFLGRTPQAFLILLNVLQVGIVDSSAFMDAFGKLIQVVAGIPEQGNQFL